ncbi:arf-GAP with dual PH domain-containing protein 1-like isoform X2 [Cloeon dipterum]|uniref:Arf-GAP with dual PH domain-containing protein 1 n=2 Tax=Cloeon dipterum TaxID=197152 RepID=A0A8S1CUG9_9INSE|nr:Hypothetical predicted protein [Cloeon dipterum]
MPMSADRNVNLLAELARRPGNSECNECGSKKPEWASYNIGVFLCTRCAGIHRGLGAHISKVKHLKLDRWEDSQVEHMKEVGNVAAKLKYEQRVPPCYRRPTESDPQVLLEQWIRAKYERLEFTNPENQVYTSGYMQGFLMKRGKDDNKYHPRRFVLQEKDGTLRYFVKEKKEPKAILNVIDLNVAFAPAKLDCANSMQLSFVKDGGTRHIFVLHNDPEEIVKWYTAIRCVKLHRYQVAYPSASESELVNCLSRDFIREGWLSKTGPRPTDSYKKRWFTLDDRTLMYHDDPMDAHPKGEIFLGCANDGYSIRLGVPPGAKELDFSFTLHTPGRSYLLSATTDDERDKWMLAIEKVIEKSLTPQDNLAASRIVSSKKKGTSGIF